MNREHKSQEEKGGGSQVRGKREKKGGKGGKGSMMAYFWPEKASVV